MSIVPANYPFETGKCFYCLAEVPADDVHTEPGIGSTWRWRCDDCREQGANTRDDLAAKVARALQHAEDLERRVAELESYDLGATLDRLEQQVYELERHRHP